MTLSIRPNQQKHVDYKLLTLFAIWCKIAIWSQLICGIVWLFLSNFIHWRKTWCRRVTCSALELNMPEWWAQNTPGTHRLIVCHFHTQFAICERGFRFTKRSIRCGGDEYVCSPWGLWPCLHPLGFACLHWGFAILSAFDNMIFLESLCLVCLEIPVQEHCRQWTTKCKYF